jgi:hypothetical protein
VQRESGRHGVTTTEGDACDEVFIAALQISDFIDILLLYTSLYKVV